MKKAVFKQTLLHNTIMFINIINYVQIKFLKKLRRNSAVGRYFFRVWFHEEITDFKRCQCNLTY